MTEIITYEVCKITQTEHGIFIEDVIEDEGFLRRLAKRRGWR